MAERGSRPDGGERGGAGRRLADAIGLPLPEPGGPKFAGVPNAMLSVSAAGEPGTGGEPRSIHAVATPPVAVERFGELATRLLDNIELVIRGKRDQITLVLCALLSDGHVLLEDVPGTAKTVLARTIARSLDGATTARIQCTPDLQPTDVTGLSVYDQRERRFVFQPGPVFANILLVDEINRAMPKTQSALLEAMAERQITVDGETRRLPAPFLILATENPLDHEGVFPLPEAQLDRFFLKAALGYPRADEELEIVRAQRHGHPLDTLEPVVGLAELGELHRAVEDVYIDPILEHWVIELVRATRELPGVRTGASVRGSLALERGARALALLRGRGHVEPGDIEALVEPILGHRLLLAHSYALDAAADERSLLERCLELAPRPGPKLA
ncbi:MAG: AAA family ATPase [Gaiellales bacterium]